MKTALSGIHTAALAPSDSPEESNCWPSEGPVAQIQRALNEFEGTSRRVVPAWLIMLLGDLIALAASLFLGVSLGELDGAFSDGVNRAHIERASSYILLSLGLVGWFWIGLQHYANRRPYWLELREITLAIIGAFLVDTTTAFLTQGDTSRSALVTMWGVAVLLVPLIRALTKHRLKTMGFLNQPYVVIGQRRQAIEAMAALESEPLMGFRPVALISVADADRCAPTPFEGRGRLNAIPHYRLDQDIEAFLAQAGPLRVVFVLDESSNPALQALAQRVARVRDDVYLVPAISGIPLYGMQLCHFFSHEVLLLRTRNNLNQRTARLLKRFFDIIGASFLILVLAPLLLAIMVLIRRENKGPVIFSQPRVGYDGHHFRFYKFRSMHMNADEMLERWKTEQPGLWEEYRASNFKLANDPRITHIGRFIRRTSLDELPQLWNVLCGDMSLVGPRPLLPRELDDYGDSIDLYGNVRPGITGLWQISGRSNTTFMQRIAMDGWYIRNWSLWHDLVILMRTVRVVLRSEGAC